MAGGLQLVHHVGDVVVLGVVGLVKQHHDAQGCRFLAGFRAHNLAGQAVAL